MIQDIKDMKTIRYILMLLMMTVSMGIQAQQFHDYLLENVKGKVKYIVYSRNSRSEVVNFSQDGKMQRSDIINPIYNKNGYMTRCQNLLYGTYCDKTYEYKNGKLFKESIKTGDGTAVTEYIYNADGTVRDEVHTITKNGLSKSFTLTAQYMDFDEQGNWTRRIITCNNKTFAETRAILYWE